MIQSCWPKSCLSPHLFLHWGLHPGCSLPPFPGAVQPPNLELALYQVLPKSSSLATYLPLSQHAHLYKPPLVSPGPGVEIDLSALLSSFSNPQQQRDIECGPLTLKFSGPTSRILPFPKFAMEFCCFTEVMCSFFPDRHFIPTTAYSRVRLWNQIPYLGMMDLDIHNHVLLGVHPITCTICCSPDHHSVSSSCSFV